MRSSCFVEQVMLPGGRLLSRLEMPRWSFLDPWIPRSQDPQWGVIHIRAIMFFMPHPFSCVPTAQTTIEENTNSSSYRDATICFEPPRAPRSHVRDILTIMSAVYISPRLSSFKGNWSCPSDANSFPSVLWSYYLTLICLSCAGFYLFQLPRHTSLRNLYSDTENVLCHLYVYFVVLIVDKLNIPISCLLRSMFEERIRQGSHVGTVQVILWKHQLCTGCDSQGSHSTSWFND